MGRTENDSHCGCSMSLNGGEANHRFKKKIQINNHITVTRMIPKYWFYIKDC